MNKDVIRLIDRLYKDLYKSESVIHHGNGNIYDKFINIESYINDLDSMHGKVKETGKHKEYLKKLYYGKYVIKRENISESYYEHHQQIALERGYGHIVLTDKMRKELQDEIINNQKSRLNIWLDYFLSNDADIYPFWAKYWAFQGMLKLGTYDKEKGTFNRRTKDTIEPFCDLNREALAMSIDMLIKMLNKASFNDKELEELVKTGSFQKIYTYILNNILINSKNIPKKNIGKWVKYNKGSDHIPLVKSLQGYNTGWCTAAEESAKIQLSNGDFYVYYTLDDNNEYKVPRIAIRMINRSIEEIRGIAKDQNIEPEMEEVVEEKIKDFPDKEKYYKKVNDMKFLTHIYKKHKNKEELSKEELIFLYEINNKIMGFGFEEDPRIQEIKNELDFNKGMKKILDGSIKRIKGSLDFRELENIDEIILPEEIGGNLDLRGLTSAKGLVLPKKISGSLNLRGLKSTEGLVLPEEIGGYLYLNSITSAKGLKFPNKIGETLDLSGLTSAEGLALPDKIGRGIYLNSITSAKGLKLPKKINGSIILSSLIDAEGLELPEELSGCLDLRGLTSAKGLVLPNKIFGYLDLRGLLSAEGLVLPEQIVGSLYLNTIKNAKCLKFPIEINGKLNLSSLINADGVVLPNRIAGSLDLRGLTSAEGLKLPQKIIGDLNLSGLMSAEGLELPIKIGGGLDLRGLTSAENLVLPQEVGGILNLNGITSAKNLVLPQSIGNDSDESYYNGINNNILLLKKLNSVEGLIIPQNLEYDIYMNKFYITPENIDQYRTSKKK